MERRRLLIALATVLLSINGKGKAGGPCASLGALFVAPQGEGALPSGSTFIVMSADVFPSSAELVVEAQENCTSVTGEDSSIAVLMCHRVMGAQLVAEVW